MFYNRHHSQAHNIHTSVGICITENNGYGMECSVFDKVLCTTRAFDRQVNLRGKSFVLRRQNTHNIIPLPSLCYFHIKNTQTFTLNKS